ncbi:hypothetical protein C1X89_18835 [Pseudomonas sp. GP01-A8]|nr:hypothetical protein TU76_02070 [Pseudomonas psychrophila]PMU26032.1 hypothetical protein C1X90_08325 [Pseudomonas sp. GP01-A9]PMU32195.1 hypothetical protein C1X88_03040 [Pseudomonas sp. GP01-A13]PMU36963.1 hypothetical protein C1X89_18835 [Pseudomonas sp. GP01-A8]PMU56248.1 hypothetical protein C1X87_02085 [Pseudomonas sp. GP01-A14]PMU57007.1 hypothetical protein C1X85_05855 [Pseudomonas sp. GP01-A6]PMU64484.1 hypothetical protein C1X86_02525 [Pseudomonas sp. GP01-A3]PMU78244.1 hypothet
MVFLQQRLGGTHPQLGIGSQWVNKCRRFSRSTQLGGIKQKLRNVRSQDRLNMQVGDADK